MGAARFFLYMQRIMQCAAGDDAFYFHGGDFLLNPTYCELEYYSRMLWRIEGGVKGGNTYTAPPPPTEQITY